VNAPLRGRKALVQRRLLPVIVTLVLLIVGQIAAFVTLGGLMNRQENQRLVSESIFVQRTSVAVYVRHTQVALFALATSDWELLIRERRGADEMAQSYEHSARTLLAGKSASPGSSALAVPQVKDPRVRQHLQEAARRWERLKIAACQSSWQP
jgi:hypothetical protein